MPLRNRCAEHATAPQQWLMCLPAQIRMMPAQSHAAVMHGSTAPGRRAISQVLLLSKVFHVLASYSRILQDPEIFSHL